MIGQSEPKTMSITKNQPILILDNRSDHAVNDSLRTAEIYFYRPKKFTNSRPEIIIGTVEPDEVIVKLKNGRWYKAEYAQLGERTFVAGVFVINPKTWDVNIEEGRKYYFRCTVINKSFKVMAEIEFVDESTAKEEIRELKEQKSDLLD